MFRSIRHRSSYFYLFIALSVLGLGYPLLEFDVWGMWVWQISFWLVLLTGLRACARHRRIVALSKILAVTILGLSIPNLILTLDDSLMFGGPWLIALAFTSFVFLSFTTVVLLIDVMSSPTVDVSRLFGATCVYFLLGLAFAELYLLVFLVADVAGMSDGMIVEHATQRFGSAKAQALYFSFVTLPTLGYGDLAPKSAAIRLFAPLEAILGQLYLTILVARLVGLHIARGALTAQDEREDTPPD